MAFKANLLQDWIGSNFPGETLVAYTTATTAGGSEEGARHAANWDNGDKRRDQLRIELGFADNAKVGGGAGTTFFVVTQTQLVVGTRSGVRNRPADVVVAVPLTDAQVHWFDWTESSTSVRHWIIDLGGGQWRTDQTGLKTFGRAMKAAHEADEFVAALGDRALQH